MTKHEELRGHERLLSDIDNLKSQAEDFQFHDLKSTYAAPKTALMNYLHSMIRQLLAGNYDDDS